MSRHILPDPLPVLLVDEFEALSEPEVVKAHHADAVRQMESDGWLTKSGGRWRRTPFGDAIYDALLEEEETNIEGAIERARELYIDYFLDEYPTLRTADLLLLLRSKLGGPAHIPAVELAILDIWRADLARFTDDAREEDPDDPELEYNLKELAFVDRCRLAVQQGKKIVIKPGSR